MFAFLGAMIQSNTIQSRSYYFTHFSEIMQPVADSNSVWKLCYRASYHGWAASIFHSNCDGIHNTVTIIRKDQYVFGGYTDIPWGNKICKNLIFIFLCQVPVAHCRIYVYAYIYMGY